MYKTINLLSLDIRGKQSNRRVLVSVVMATVLGLCCVGCLWLALKMQRTDLEEVIGSRTSVSLESVPKVSSTSSKALGDKQMASRIATINSKTKTEIDWERAFKLVNSLVSKEMVLSNYSVVSGGTGLSLKMAGTVNSNVSFANYVEFLKEQKEFTGKTDGYTYDPKTGKVTFSVDGTIPLSSLVYLTTNP